MENLNAEQIKKALECCNSEHSCIECPYCDDCYDGKVCENALALINSQDQRIKELTEENERLRGECENQSVLWRQHFESIYETAKETVKAATVRKMHSEIKERCIKGGIYPAFVERTIDQIAKEMLEGAE